MDPGITNGLGPLSSAADEATYTISPEDQVAWSLHHYDWLLQQRDNGSHARWVRLGLILLHVLVIAVIVLIVWLHFAFAAHPYRGVRLAPSAGLITFVLLDVLLWTGVGRNSLARRFDRHLTRKRSERIAKSLCVGQTTCRIRLLPDHCLITEETRADEPGIAVIQRAEATVSWATVRRIDVTGAHLFLVLQPIHKAFILPRRDFPDEAAFLCFAARVRAYHEGVTYAPVCVLPGPDVPDDRLHTVPESP
jgi:hypothetical protein